VLVGWLFASWLAVDASVRLFYSAPIHGFVVLVVIFVFFGVAIFGVRRAQRAYARFSHAGWLVLVAKPSVALWFYFSRLILSFCIGRLERSASTDLERFEGWINTRVLSSFVRRDAILFVVRILCLHARLVVSVAQQAVLVCSVERFVFFYGVGFGVALGCDAWAYVVLAFFLFVRRYRLVVFSSCGGDCLFVRGSLREDVCRFQVWTVLA